MKTRSGFVSNSSSSSFCILGVTIDRETEQKLEKFWRETNHNGRVHVKYDISGGEGIHVGVFATSIQDDETPHQIKREVINSLHEAGVDVGLDKISWIEDGGYNG